MNVLLVTRGSSGHIGPLVPFGKACVRAGHDVVVAAQRQFADNVERAGLAFTPFDDPKPEEWMPLLGQFGDLDMASADRMMIGKFFAGIDVRAALPGLRAIVERRRPDLIIRESWEFASTLVAELERIPVARVGLGQAEFEEMSIESAAPELDAARAELGLPSDPAGERLHAMPYLTMIPEELENPDATSPPRTHRFRAGVSEPPSALPDWWPGNDDPLVYLTFGSVAAASHLPFYPDLYRSAIDRLAALPIRLLVTVGDAARVDELGPLPPDVHVETWVPNDDAAAAAAAIVCHGGYGSTLGALRHGVPQVVLPLFSGDQWTNGDAVVRAGAGISLAGDRPTRRSLGLPPAESVDELGASVEAVLSDASYGREARRIADAIEALPPVDASVEVLEALAAATGTRRSRA